MHIDWLAAALTAIAYADLWQTGVIMVVVTSFSKGVLEESFSKSPPTLEHSNVFLDSSSTEL